VTRPPLLALLVLAVLPLAAPAVQPDRPPTAKPTPDDDKPLPPGTEMKRRPVPGASAPAGDAIAEGMRLIEQIVKGARSVSEKLAARDTGEETRHAQRDLLALIDRLLNPPPQDQQQDQQQQDKQQQDKQQNQDQQDKQRQDKQSQSPENQADKQQQDKGQSGGQSQSQPGGGASGDSQSQPGGGGQPSPGGASGSPRPRPQSGRGQAQPQPQTKPDPHAGRPLSRREQRALREKAQAQPPGGKEELVQKDPNGKPEEQPGPKPDPAATGQQQAAGKPSGQPDRPNDGPNGQEPPRQPPEGMARTIDPTKSVWGHLPLNVRKELDTYYRDQFMPKYQELLKQYYSSTAERDRPVR
jgi:hypothetical protein